MITKIKFLAVALIVCVTTVTTSCSKEDENSISEVESKLTGSWLKSKVESRLSEQDWVDISQSCQLDDTEEYLSNGKWNYYSGTILCSGESGLVYPGTWKLAASDTKIIFTYDDSEGEYESNIESVTETELVLTHATGLTNGSERRVTYIKKT